MGIGDSREDDTVASVQTQHNILIWLDAQIKATNDNYSFDIIERLRRINNFLYPFQNDDQCVDFIKMNTNARVHLIVSGSFGRRILPAIHDLSQMKSIIIFCVDKTKHEQWANEFSKIIGVYTDIESICELLTVSNEHSFIYTKILKEIFLSINFDENSIRSQKIIIDGKELFKKPYHERTPIEWYAEKSYIRSILDHAFQTMNIDVLLKLGFFIKNLDNQITNSNGSLVVYYEQIVFKDDFQRIYQQNKKILGFNQFLLTTKLSPTNQSSKIDKNSVQIIFRMNINSSIPFVSIDNKEQLILFSTHTIFRIDKIENLENGSQPFYQVNLTLIEQNDDELYNQLQNELASQSDPWNRLSYFLVKIQQVKKAEEFFENLLATSTSTIDRTSAFIQLGYIRNAIGKHEQALRFYEQALEIQQKQLPPNHPDLCISYTQIGDLYAKLNDNSKALDFYKRTQDIYERTLVSTHPNFIAICNRIKSITEH